MKIEAFVFILISSVAITSNAQIHQQLEDENYLYWHINTKLEYSHFQSETNEECDNFNSKYNLKMSPNIQLKGIVDIPKSHLSKRIKKRKGFDILYLAPVFCKKCSCMLSEDSIELVVYQLMFDAAEMCARGIRKELIETQAQMNINNVNTTFYTTVKNKWEERMRGTWASIYQDVLIQKKVKSFDEWRELIDELLEKNKNFSTERNEIKRLMLEKPVKKDYVQAKSILGDLKSENEK